MRIGVNGKFLSAERITGVERAAGMLLRHLALQGGGHEWILFYGSEVDEGRLADFAGFRRAPSWRLTGRLKKNYWEQRILPRLAAREGVDLLLNPANVGPVGFAANLMFLYDVSFAVDAAWHSRSFGLYYRFLVKRLVRRAVRIVVPSFNTRKDLMAAYAVPEGKVAVIPLGVDGAFSSSNDGDGAREGILAVGSLEPRKNFQRLIEAFVLLKKGGRLEGKLTVVGAAGANFRKVRYDFGGHGDDIYFKGYVRDEELIALYRRSALFVYPSLYEGFGLPVLEAMACGCPVVTSNCSSLPEVAGDAAVLVDPEDPEAIAGAIEEIMGDEPRRRTMAARGLERARQFTWERTARLTLDSIAGVSDAQSVVV